MKYLSSLVTVSLIAVCILPTQLSALNMTFWKESFGLGKSTVYV